MGKITREKKILITFLKEFNPIHDYYDLENWTYDDLVTAVKETAEEM